MSDASGVGATGYLSSHMRSITRQTGDPQDHEARRVEDVVALSPQAATEQRQTDRPIEPTDAPSGLSNPGAEKVRHLREKAEAKAEEVEQNQAVEEGSDVGAGEAAKREAASLSGGPNPAAGGAYARSEALGEPQLETPHDVAKA